MKIAFLAQRHSIHTVRWVNALAERGHDVHLISSTNYGNPLHPKVTFHSLPIAPPLGYFLNIFALKKLLKRLQPDLLNAHFASGYGTLARLCNFHPYILNVWGSDVFDFPNKSLLHRQLIQSNLRAADWVSSTSQAMARQTQSLLSSIKQLSVVPFGIDTSIFRPNPTVKEQDKIVIGTVKTLAPKYGIDLLLQAFARLITNIDNEHKVKLRLLIVGGGGEERNLKDLAHTLGIAHLTEFVGPITHSEVPNYLNKLDIYIALSRLESFGVAVLEASACSLPVVVANVGGLPEVVKDGLTGQIVPKEDPIAAATMLERLVKDTTLRNSLGKAGRAWVLENYDWQKNVSQMESIYQNVIKLYS
jgi:L-malate glycosyltransferase